MKARIPLLISGPAVAEHIQKAFHHTSPKDTLKVQASVRSGSILELYCTITQDEQEIVGSHQAVIDTLSAIKEDLEKLGLEGEYKPLGGEHQLVFTNTRKPQEPEGRFIPEVTAETHIEEMLSPLLWESKVEELPFGMKALTCHGKVLAVTSGAIDYTWIYKETIWGVEAVEQHEVPRGDLIRNQENFLETVHGYIKAVSTLQKLGISF